MAYSDYYRGRIDDKSSAREYTAESDMKDRIEEQRRATPALDYRMMNGMTCREWLVGYRAEKEALRNPPKRKQETIDDQDGREIAGPQAAEISAGEGVGHTPEEQGGDREGQEEAVVAGRPDISGEEGRSPDWIEQAIGPSGDATGHREGQDGPGWLDEAYPEDGQAWTREEDTPF